MRNLAEELSFKLKDGNLAAFTGAGISKTFTEKGTGKIYEGIPTASEIVKSLAVELRYINESMPFEKAFFLMKKNESRQGVIRRLEGFIDRKNINPLPAHGLLASMPFTAYLTTNFDTLLERAFDTSNKRYATIIQDTDVTKWQGSQIPLIKLHGCIKRPESLVAAEDEYENLDKKLPIVTSLVKTLLSNKNVLFLGYSLNDNDFRRQYEELLAILGDYMPKSYAVVNHVTAYDEAYWNDKGLTIIKGDATEFLRSLKNSYLGQHFDDSDNITWENNSFFSSLSQITSAPSETQAIDAFLNHLYEMACNSSLSCEEILRDADSAVKLIITQKSNFEAFRNLWKSMYGMLSKFKDDTNAFQSHINDVIDDREQFAKLINRRWNEVVKQNSNILVFSQSVRMLDLLKNVPANTQRTCELYICECRPKSPNELQDALAICKYLEGTYYKSFNIIPDMAAGNLIVREKIDSILMGAHSVYIKDNRPISFVNTCGTVMIYTMAEKYNIPFYLIAEKAKFVYCDESEDKLISYEEEADIFNNTPSNCNISFENIGYDLCCINDEMVDTGYFKIISD